MTRLIPAPETQPTGEETTNRDAHEGDILFSRGIRVLELEVSSLRVPQDVERERLLQWREAWYGETQTALQDARESLEAARRRGESEAILLMLRKLPVRLDQALAQGDSPSTRDSLNLILHGALALCDSEGSLPEANHLVPQFEQILEDLEHVDGTCRDTGT
jgi:hypothetical protein